MNLRGRNKVNPNFNMSSMTDIVFLLLIFFMLSSTLVTVSAIDVLLPKAGGKTENNASVAISITNQSKFYIDKTLVSEKNLELEILRNVGIDKKKTIVIRVASLGKSRQVGGDGKNPGAQAMGSWARQV